MLRYFLEISMHSKLRIILTTFLTILFHQQVQAESQVASTLLNAFKGQCPSIVTRHVQGSLYHIESLMNVVAQLKEDSQCFGHSNMVEVLSNYQRIYGEYEVYQSSRNGKDELEHTVAHYTHLLTDPGLSSEDQAMIQANIVLAQSELVTIQSELSRFQTFSSNHALGAAQVLTSVEGILNTMAQSPACFEKKGSLLGGLLSQSLLSTAAFAAPGTALALAASGVVVGSITSFLESFKYNQSLSYLDDENLPTALRCVSQALSDQYCDSQESLSLIDLYRDHYNNSSSSLEGIDLLSKEMGHLAHWLQEVYAGSAITSQGDLVNREKPILQAELLEKIIRYIQTYVTIRKRTFNDISNAKEKSEAIAIGISSLVSIMQSPTLTPTPPSPFGGMNRGDNSLENPIFVSRDKKLLPFSLFDPALSDIPDCPTGGSTIPKCGTLLDYIRNRGLTLNMSHWDNSLTNALTVVGDTLDQVNIERARTISVDAFSVLVRARSDLRGETNAYDSLIKIHSNAERIATYLEQKDPIRYAPQVSNARKTGVLSLTILNLIKEAYIPRTMPPDSLPEDCRSANQLTMVRNPGDVQEVKSFQITSCITKILKLAERGNDVFFQKIRDMVGYEIEARFLSGEFDDQVSDVVYATRNDLVNSLMDSFNEGDHEVSLEEIYRGIETSIRTTNASYLEFFRFFEKGISRSFNVGLSTGELNDFCFKILPYLSEGNQDLLKTAFDQCHRVKMQFYRNGPSLAWGDFVEKKKKRGFLGRKKWYYSVKGSKSENFACFESTIEKTF